MRSNRGLSLIELLVVMLSLAIVGSMAFQLLWQSNTSVHRNLSESSKADRLRILQKSMTQDLSSSYPNLLAAGAQVASSSAEGGGKAILRTRILDAQLGEDPILYEVEYALQEYPEQSGRMAVVRTLDPDLSEERGDGAQTKRIFTLDVEETLDWSVEATDWRGSTSPSVLKFTLTNHQFEDYRTQREILVHGAQAR